MITWSCFFQSVKDKLEQVARSIGQPLRDSRTKTLFFVFFSCSASLTIYLLNSDFIAHFTMLELDTVTFNDLLLPKDLGPKYSFGSWT